MHVAEERGRQQDCELAMGRRWELHAILGRRGANRLEPARQTGAGLDPRAHAVAPQHAEPKGARVCPRLGGRIEGPGAERFVELREPVGDRVGSPREVPVVGRYSVFFCGRARARWMLRG